MAGIAAIAVVAALAPSCECSVGSAECGVGVDMAKRPWPGAGVAGGLQRRKYGAPRNSGRTIGLFPAAMEDRKSTRLNSSHLVISYAVFCLKKKNQHPCLHPNSAPSLRTTCTLGHAESCSLTCC